MKKLIALALALVMALALTVPALAAEEKPKMKLGTLEMLSRTEDERNSLTDEVENSEDNKFPLMQQNNIQYICYNTLSELLMALDAGYVDVVQADEPMVQYVISRNDAYAEFQAAVEHQIEYSMLFLEEDGLLCDQFSEAIKAMKDDGTLDTLAAEYIDGVIAGEDPEAVAFPTFEGADTVTVAVTGDVPPMDYVDDTGHAAGFNTAVLAEIAQRLELNIELIQVDSSARSLALSSGRADVAFWVQTILTFNKNDVPEGTVASEPYYATELCGLTLAAE